MSAENVKIPLLSKSGSESLEQIRNSKCRLCPLWQNAQTICLSGYGNPNADIVIVGEAPGEEEDLVGKPFVGRAGKLLTNLLAEFNIDRESVYITNAVKCRPLHNLTPNIRYIRACQRYLIKEIATIKPKLILALGNTAMKSLMDTGSFTLSKARGKLHTPAFKEIQGIPILVTYHPAAILRTNSFIGPTLTDLERALSYVKQGNRREPVVYKKGIVSHNEASPIWDPVAIDLETTSLDMFDERAKILCVGTSNTSNTGYCSTDISSIKHILLNPDIWKVGHNFKFDYKWLVSRGYKIQGPIFDTMVAAHMVDENLPSYGLKELALAFTDMGAYAEKMERAVKLVKGDMTKIPEKILHYYCAADADATIRLYKLFKPRLKEENLWPLFQLTMRGEKLFARAEIDGVQIDIDKVEELQIKYENTIDRIQKDIAKIGGEDFNPNSSQQLGELLFEKLGLPMVKATKKGAYSTDVESLNKLMRLDKTGVVKLILKLRKYRGDYSKYLESPIWNSDGRVHCDIRINGTDTGRYSCVNPNLQQVTKDSPIKSIFISRYRNGRIIQADYDQGELRILAQYSQDRTLLKTFREGKDIHTATAAGIFGVSYDSVTKDQRFAAKTINFGIIYGMGPEKLAHTLGISFTRAARYIQDYKDRFGGVKKYIRDKEAEILENNQVISLFGRRRRIYIIDEENTQEVRSAQRRAVNAPIQGALHDLNILSATRLDYELKLGGYQCKTILAVHDSVILDCPLEEVEEVEALIKKVFCNPDTSKFGFEFNVPLTVSVAHGKDWKEAAEA